MISFANPIWLYGLLGLLVPIGIHLLSRKEGKTIYIGSIRHLTDSDTAQFSSIRLNEILLLILRLLLLTVLVFILAGFSFNLNTNDKKRWLVIEKGVEKEEQYKPLLDSLNTNGFEIHWLTSGLPKFKDSTTSVDELSYYKLLTDIELQADTAVVLSYGYANRFKGEKISLPAKVKWLSVEPRESSIVVQAVQIKGDSVITRLMNSNSTGTAFDYKRISNNNFEQVAKVDSLQLDSNDTIEIAIISDAEFDYDKKIIMASLRAIANNIPQKFNVLSFSKSEEFSGYPDFVFWLSDEQCTVKEATVIGYSMCNNSNLPVLISNEEVSKCTPIDNFDWIITKRLNEENALAESLSFQLAKILLKNLPIYQNHKVAYADKRSFTAEAAFDNTSTTERRLPAKTVSAETEPPLFIVLFLLLIVERYVAFKRNQ